MCCLTTSRGGPARDRTGRRSRAGGNAVHEINEAQAALREYSITQERLCSALSKKYGIVLDRFLSALPSSGVLELDSQVWRFRKHGVGVMFERLSDRAIFDAHQHMEICPACFDAWRLSQYFSLKSIFKLNVGAKLFDARDEKSLTDMLEELVRVGAATLRSDLKAYVLS